MNEVGECVRMYVLFGLGNGMCPELEWISLNDSCTVVSNGSI